MTRPATDKTIVVGVTGASGALYATRLIASLIQAEVETHVVVSQWGKRLLRDELDINTVNAESLAGKPTDRLIIHPHSDVGSILASGSFVTDGMVICPCSSNTLGEISAGIGDSLIARAAAVTLKEGRRLILVPRETPTSQIDLRNMLRLSEAGAIICPANPGFYMKPKRIEDLVDFMVGKLLDLLKVPHELNTRWTGGASGSVKG